MACRSGCKDQDCESYAACCKRVKVAYSGRGGLDYTAQKKDDKELARYRQALSEGLDPRGTTNAAINAAYEEAEKS